jgi:hypothetical protein
MRLLFIYMFDRFFSYNFRTRQKEKISFYYSFLYIFCLIYLNIVEIITLVYFVVNNSILNIISGWFVWVGLLFIFISIFFTRKQVHLDQISQTINSLPVKQKKRLKLLTIAYISLTLASYIWIVIISIKNYQYT